jgi:hypothetical protein
MATLLRPFMGMTSGSPLVLKGFRDQAEGTVKALYASISRNMDVHLVHKNNAHHILFILLTDLVQHILKLHHMMDGQFLHCRTILGMSCDNGNWILNSQFPEAVFAGTWRARLIGSDYFNETGHTQCLMCLWASLQINRVLQGYIKLDFIAHPKVSSVVVGHYLIQTTVAMTMHDVVIADVKYLKAHIKSSRTTVDKLESKFGHQATDAAKVQQEMKTALTK